MVLIKPFLHPVKVKAAAKHPLLEVANPLLTGVAPVPPPQLLRCFVQQCRLLVRVLFGGHLVADLVKDRALIPLRQQALAYLLLLTHQRLVMVAAEELGCQFGGVGLLLFQRKLGQGIINVVFTDLLHPQVLADHPRSLQARDHSRPHVAGSIFMVVHQLLVAQLLQDRADELLRCLQVVQLFDG